MNIILLIIILIVIVISLGQSLPILSKSLLTILPDDPININRYSDNGSWNKILSDTVNSSNIKTPIIRHNLNLPIKKNSYLKREWSIGSLPFSILYANTQRGAHTSDLNRVKNTEKSVTSSIPSTKQPNNRLATMRNRNSGQIRRQYSIIPELFMSFSWRHLGK